MAEINPTISLQTAPARHTEKERLTWERELMGLYISAHPLDNYDAYFEEQTIPLSHIKPDADGKKVTIGGLVSTVRTIITKSGTKMAFVGIEDKTSEAEVIIFPNLYEQVGAKLVQDAVIRVGGKISARDRDGNLGSDAKLIADEVNVVTDKELREYESTGRKMEAPRMSAKVKAERRAAYKAAKNGTPIPTQSAADVAPKKVESPAATAPAPRSVADVPLSKKLFVHIKDPDDHSSLLSLKQLCGEFPGGSDIILVLGETKKSAIKLPFSIDVNDTLVGELVKLLGEDCVVMK